MCMAFRVSANLPWFTTSVLAHKVFLRFYTCVSRRTDEAMIDFDGFERFDKSVLLTLSVWAANCT